MGSDRRVTNGITKEIQMEEHEREQWMEWGSDGVRDETTMATAQLFRMLFGWHLAQRTGIP
jgi:hypothetical protein